MTVAKIQSEFVGGQIVAWQLPPVSRRICQRQRVIPFEGKKNGGLEMSFKTADGESNLKIGARNYLPRSTVFFFPRTGQITYYAERSRCALIGSLYLFLQFPKGRITDGVLHPASLLFRRFQIDAGGHKLLRKKQMAFIDFLGNLPAYGGQMEESIFIHGQKTAILQNAYRMADTRFTESHVPGKINGADHALLLLEYQHSLQIVLPGRMNLHQFLLYAYC